MVSTQQGTSHCSTQVKGMDYGDTYAPVARLESIHILLAYANHHDITLYQMDIAYFMKIYPSEASPSWAMAMVG